MAEDGRDVVCPYCRQVVEVDRRGRMVKHKSGGLAGSSYAGGRSNAGDICNGSRKEVEPV